MSNLDNKEELKALNQNEEEDFDRNDGKGDDEIEEIQYKLAKPTILQYCVIPLSFIVYFLLFGLTNNIGTIKPHWEISTKESLFINQAGSVNFTLLYLMSILATILVKLVGCGYTYMIGCILSCVAFLIMALVNNHICIFLCYGIILGVGSSLVLFSILFIVADIFTDNLSVVNGIITSGSCLGTMIQSLLLNKILHAYGYDKIFGIYAIIMFVLMFFGVLFHFSTKKSATSEVKIKKECDNTLVVSTICSNIKFNILCVGCFVFTIGYLVPFFYLKSYAETKNIEAGQAATLIGYYSIGSLIGRLLFGFGANFVGQYKILLFIASFFVMGCSNIISLFCRSLITFILFSAVLGFFEGGFISLTVPVITDLYSDILPKHDASTGKNILNLAITVNFMVQALGMLIGPIITNYMIAKGVSYDIVFAFSGGLFVLSSLIVAANRFIRKKTQNVVNS